MMLVRNWGRIGTTGRVLGEAFAGEIKASQALAQHGSDVGTEAERPVRNPD